MKEIVLQLVLNTRTVTQTELARYMHRVSFCCLVILIVLSCSSSDTYTEQGRQLMQQGKYREAVQALNKSIEVNAQNADAFNARGVAYFELKELANAQLDYEQAIKLTPNAYRPYYNRALLRVAQNDGVGALQDYSKAIRLAPDTAQRETADVYLNRGQLFAAQDQIQPALNDFSQAIRLDPHNAIALYNRGNLLYNQKNLPAAIADFQQAVAADPKFGKAFYALGIAQVLQQESGSGCLSLKQAQQLGYADAVDAVKAYCSQ